MGDRVLVLGGAGFIGSTIAARFAESGHAVTVIDGLLPRTGGRRDNIAAILPGIEFINSRVEDVADLPAVLSRTDLIVDCMAWTSHRAALEDPLYDLELNQRSHLCLLGRLKEAGCSPKIIYLGSRGQYGSPAVARITEETPLAPVDVQGIHKTGAEWYFRVFAQLHRLNVVSIRFPNCFGPHQPVSGGDIGLVGGFIRDLLDAKTVTIYGDHRKRNLVYVSDLSEVVVRLASMDFTGFSAFNLKGFEVSIEELVALLCGIIGKGGYDKQPLPDEIRSIDIGNAEFADEKLERYLGAPVLSDLKASLAETVRYFQEELQ